MGRIRTDVVALATIVGAAAVSVLITTRLVSAPHTGQASCVTAPAEVSFMRDGHNIRIRTSEGSRAVFIQGDLRANEDHGRKRRRRRHRHRHPHAEMRMERCIEQQMEANMSVLEAELEEMEARIEADMAEFEPQLDRLKIRIRSEGSN